MADYLEYKTGDGVAILSLASGPDGGPAVLDAGMRAALAAALDRAESDDAAAGVVITGEGRSFPGGVPVAEVAGPEAAPELGDICCRIETFPKPVVAALRGEVFDGGLALALAAHARLAALRSRLGVHDIRRGLVPGAGITQRLPRLVGAGAALDMILAGRTLGAESGHLRGLFRKVVPRNVVGEAVQAALELAAAGHPAPDPDLPPGMTDPTAYQQALAKRRDEGGTLPPEAEAVLECIEAAQLLPLEAGLAMEATLRADLRGGARARGLIRTTALELRRGVVPEDMRILTVLGDGALARDLAGRGLSAGFGVRLAEQRVGGADMAIDRLAAMLDQAVVRGQISATVRDERLSRLAGGASEDMLEEADFVIEACGAPASAMADLAGLLERATGGSVPVMLSSNMALHGGDLHRVLGPRMHGLALSPRPGAGSAGLAEILRSNGATDEAMADAGAVLQALGYATVVCPPRNGLISGRLKVALLSAAEWCVARGATPSGVDAALGWAVGPFHQADSEGLALQVERMRALGRDRSEDSLIASLVAAGRGGKSVGHGVFRYASRGAEGDYDAAARDIVDGWRGAGESGALSAAGIRRRIWSALFSAGLRMLDDGTAEDAGDIDLAALEALALPRASGGPMKTGEIRGLLAVRRELDAWSADDATIWSTSPRLNDMVKYGGGFGF